jgi:protein TonB
MFQSVIEQQEWKARRLGTGASVSLALHAGAIAVAMLISAKVVDKVKEEPPLVVYMQPHPKGTPAPAVTKTVVEPPKPKNKPQTPVRPTVIKPLPLDPPPVAQVEPADTESHDPTARPDGNPDADPCQKCSDDPTTPIPVAVLPPVNTEETLPFSQGTMTPPKLLSGAPLQYTREALEAHVSGLLIAKCVITREGEVENCRIIKGLPHMDEAVLSALTTRRYTPVTYQGRPIGVSYIFNVKLDLPR